MDQSQFGTLHVRHLLSLLDGLIDSKWTGVVHVEMQAAVKSLYFASGDLVFATSQLVDDRLGEIIYRDEMILLSDFTAAAAKVSREKKFGQVLVESGVFTHHDLWNALLAQVTQILDSLFMVENVLVEMQAGQQSRNKVLVKEGTRYLLERSYFRGLVLRKAANLIDSESMIFLIHPAQVTKVFPRGTFMGDLVSLIPEKIRVGDFIQATKLPDRYAMMLLLKMRARNICNIAIVAENDDADEGLEQLNASIANYERKLTALIRRFEAEFKVLPLSDLREFNQDAQDPFSLVIQLDPHGFFEPSSKALMFKMAKEDARVIQHFDVRIQGMLYFLDQLAQDCLSREGYAILQEEKG